MPHPQKRGSSAVAFRKFALYFLRLGTFGFGGPIVLASHMQRDLVEQRRWVSKPDYLEGLAFSQLSPGPLAAQLAIYLGWLRAGTLGATVVGAVFVLPSFLMVLVLAALYVRYGGLSWVQGVFYGIGASVIAIMAKSAYGLVRTTLGRDRLLWLLWTVMAAVTAVTEAEIVWLFVLCGFVAVAWRSPIVRPHAGLWFAPLAGMQALLSGAHGPASAATVGALFLFFAKAGAFVFGSGLAIVPFLYGGVVKDFGWLNERQFLDAVAVAMITPGPVVITAAFIGYLVAGPLGALAAASAVFAPPYLFVVVAARYYRKFGQVGYVKDFVNGVTAAAVGAITGAALVLGQRALVDVPAILIAVGSLALMLTIKKLPEPALVLASGILGLLLHGR